ncbi:MAG: hypothetical protein CMJ31_06335 [Phycisphaerae bacterium]|nr:hypothetical protein [Phycisphaerae bacterium]
MGARHRHLEEVRRLAAVAIAATLLAGALGGCTTTAPASVYAQGETGVRAVYSNNGLTGALPPQVRVPSVIAAADQAMGSAGYIVTARDVTLHRGRLVARPPDRRLGRKINIEAREGRDATVFTLVMKPSGDEATSRDIFERVLTRLGL